MYKSLKFYSLVIVLLGICGAVSGAGCVDGDLDGSGRIGIEDLILFAEQWLDLAGCAGYGDDCADLVGNDGVDNLDFAVFANN